VQFAGGFSRGTAALRWTLQASSAQNQLEWQDRAEVFEAYASLKTSAHSALDFGKKVFKWGKGYAANPVGFIDRPKDPNNPEEAMEGYVGAGLDLVKSLDADLKTVALTTVALPVWQGVNEEFGSRDNVNLAAKLSLLYKDTDIDFLWYAGNSRTPRYGIDFARNLAAHFEIHGELAHIPRQKQRLLTEARTVATQTTSDTSYLLGFRYLTETDLTAIVEFYHNGDGYTEPESERFFALAESGHQQFLATGDASLLGQVAALAQQGYSQPLGGRNYLYARLSQKEPFDILYLTPGLTAILNLGDKSCSLSPELVYTGFTNWELRLRFTMLVGPEFSEYGEKPQANRLEARLRYFF